MARANSKPWKPCNGVLCQFAFLDRAELTAHYPQINVEGVGFAILESTSGVLMARRAVAAVVNDAIRRGAEYRLAQVLAPDLSANPAELRTAAGESISAGKVVFACGAWLGKVFPEILGSRIFPTRQEVFFFATPPGDSRFASPAMPTWLFQEDEVYGMPDIESRGFKIALDRHGAIVDPETQSRLASPEAAEQARSYVARRFPSLRNAPIVESRVCQYENTSSGDFLVDRHPARESIWFVGGGSGHGFKTRARHGRIRCRSNFRRYPVRAAFLTGRQRDHTAQSGLLTIPRKDSHEFTAR